MSRSGPRTLSIAAGLAAAVLVSATLPSARAQEDTEEAEESAVRWERKGDRKNLITVELPMGWKTPKDFRPDRFRAAYFAGPLGAKPARWSGNVSLYSFTAHRQAKLARAMNQRGEEVEVILF